MLLICPKCHASYDSYSQFCNRCEITIDETNAVERVIDYSGSGAKIKVFSIIVFVIAGVGFVLYAFTNAKYLSQAISLYYHPPVYLPWANDRPEPLSMSYVLLWPICLSLVILGFYLRRYAVRLQQVSGYELMSNDPREPILFLRSFKRDNTRLLTNTQIFFRIFVGLVNWGFFGRMLITFEESLVEQLYYFGPVIAVNNPGKKGRPSDVGAARIDLSNDWQERVLDLSKKSRFVVIMLDETEGLQWELKNITGHQGFEKVLIIFPLLRSKREIESFQIGYLQLQESFEYLPNLSSDIAAVAFNDKSTKPQAVICRKCGFGSGILRVQTIVQHLAECYELYPSFMPLSCQPISIEKRGQIAHCASTWFVVLPNE